MIVIVVGMHRSGTSALAGVLHRHGIIMGEERNFRPRPSRQNPKGFYENVLFRKVSDKILADCGYQVKSWNPVVPAVQAGYLNRFRVRRLLSRYNRRYPRWGWKDPRACLTLGVWLDELSRLDWRDDVRIVYISRDPRSVAQSMVTRGNTSFDVAVELWTVYNQRALEAIDRTSMAACFITYEALCRDPIETTEALLTFLDVPPDRQAVDEFIDRQLDRSSVPTALSASDPISPTATRVARELAVRQADGALTSSSDG